MPSSQSSGALDGVRRFDNEPPIEIQYFTDPLCCWSWAFEPQWRRLRYEYSGQLKWRYVMGGMLPDWKRFSDPINDINRPIQMGPLWSEARHLSGMPIADTLWSDDPPQSSYPACMAVKCAQQQSADAGEAYLRALREAVMMQGRNIARRQTLMDIATQLAQQHPSLFDRHAFEQMLSGAQVRDAFEQDLHKVRFHNLNRFPALTLQRSGGAGVVIVGYRPYAALVDALEQVAPGIVPTRYADSEDRYRHFWGDATEREVREALASSVAA